jgi:hypothetical protein
MACTVIAVQAGAVDDEPGVERPRAGLQAPAGGGARAARDLGGEADLGAVGKRLEQIGERRRPGVDDGFAGDQDRASRGLREMRLALA